MTQAFGAIVRNRAALASGATLTAAAVVVSTLAVLYQGVPTADLKLDDGGVWVTKTDDLLVGHLNYPSRILDSAVRTRTPEFDVLQDGDSVIVVDAANNAMTAVDAATTEFLGDAPLPDSAAVAVGAETVGVLGGGLLYSVAVNAIAGATFVEDGALAEIGPEGDVAVARDGSTIFAVSKADSELVSVSLAATEPTSVALDRLADDAVVSIAAVGDRAVVFDSANGVLFRPDGSRVEIPEGIDGRLQQSSDIGSTVYVATPTALISVDLDGGTLTTVAEVSEGVPNAPVSLNGCVYGVWGSTGTYVRDCAGESDDLETTIDAPTTSTLALRTNRRVVVVNDTTAGTVWVVNEQVERVENWDDIIPPPDIDADEEESEEEKPQYDLPERSAENTPPIAEDDDYGVRAGRTTLLRVTENDSDPDGDLLAASLVGEAPTGFDITPVLGGSALQATVPANASGATSFAYRVEDGRGGSDEARVTMTVHPPEVNSAPEQKRPTTVQVEAGASVTYSALDGWSDPDGDDFFLESASVEGGDVVTFRSNGVLEYTAASGVVGLHEVKLVVSDGRDKADGVLRVDVRPAGTLNPIANADRVTATAGIPITVWPLANDVSPTGKPLALSKTDAPNGARVTPDHAANSFDFVAETPGPYYVQYLVTDGPRSAVGIVRIDVVAGDAASVPPVAVRDLALLPTGRDVLVDVLANDSDPTGGILVVQSARAAAGSGVSAEVLQHSVLRITDLSGLTSPVTVTYVISNGVQSATGEVLVMPVPLPENLRPPVTVDDAAIVRVGDVVSISVLANDYHPDNDTITLMPDLVETDVVDTSSIFVDGDRIRFQAGSEPGTVHATYEVEDSQLNRTAGYVTIQVLPANEATNSAPRAKPVIARVIAGNTIRIPIPLEGIDADGDSVELLGASSNPTKGRVSTGDSWLTYEAYSTPDAYGRDTFTYQVRDHLGAVAESTVTVGVAAPGVDNQPPYAVKDTVTVRPGRVVAVPVTVNDSDPDGDEISILSDGLTVPDSLDAEVIGGRVVVTAPNAAGQYTLTYTIADAYGATAEGVLLVIVDPEAPPRAPIARDDRVSPLSIGSAPTVAVSVLDNDEDPDGTTDDLTVKVVDSTAVVSAAGVVSVTLQPAPQIIRYSITDQDALVGQAFIFVPGLDAQAPVLSTTEPIRVRSGETIAVPLAENVHVRDGRVPRISVADSVRTSHSNGAPLIRDEVTLEYTSADGYFGPDTLGVQVTDGTGPDDPDGRAAYISIPILVLPAENQSPTMRNASVSVAPGEGEVTVNLAKLAYDPDEGDLEKLSFSIDGAVPAGYSASIAGSTLKVSASADVDPSASQTLTIVASDGTSEPGRGTVTIVTVVSQRPFPVANDDVIPKADQGEARTVDVLANDFNPFAGESPLTVVSARVDTVGSGTAEVSGDQVVVTPGADFTGSMIVTYRIADATASPDREVDGRIVLTVQGRPDAPGVPTVTSIQDRTVVLSWAPPANNGAAITSYTVSSPQGYSKTCSSTTCTLDGLTNDVEYTFQVVAVNEVGESDPSPTSAVARPDARPDTPAPPVLVFGDKSLAVSWSTPRSTGSPVLSYTLEISPAPATGSLQKTGVTGNSLTWEGLENGTAYRVKVQAVNRAPEPSEWSPYQSPVVPAGVPDAPGSPSTTPSTPVGAQAQIAVTWAAPASDNGDRVSGYTLSVKRGGSVLQSIPVVGTSQNVVVDTSETDYTFAVTARNKAGDSAASADSSPRRGATAPGAPTAVSLTPSDRAVNVTFAPGALNGNRAGEMTYHYRINQTGAQGTLPAGGGTVGGLNNGTAYTINVWGSSSVQGVSPGPEATSTEAIPFGAPIITHRATERQDGAVTFRWHVNANGRPLSQASHGSEGENSFTQSGLGPNKTATLNVSYANEAGGASAGWSGQSNDKSASVTRGGRDGAGNDIFVLNTRNFDPGTYELRCFGNESGSSFTSVTVPVPANGSVNACGGGWTTGWVYIEVLGYYTTPRTNIP